MQTYSHYILTAVLNRQLKQRQSAPGDSTGPVRLPPLKTFPLMLGSIAPDLPLIGLTIIFLLSDLLAGRLGPGSDGSTQRNVAYLFEVMFFHDPWIKAAHNLFHAPILTVAYLGLGYWLWRRGFSWGPGLFWFGLACTLHTAIDIPLHYDDGPLLFFPFDWQTRFHSPLSYWDSARYGRQFAIFEHGLVLGMLIYLARGWWRERRAAVPV